MIEVELKNTITAGGAKAIKQILCNTKLEESTLGVIGCILDIMTCNGELNQSELVSINESQARVIEKLKGEVEVLKDENRKIELGDFTLEQSIGNGSQLCVYNKKGWKILKQADVAKKLRELYYRTEEKSYKENPCAICKHAVQKPEYISCNVCCFNYDAFELKGCIRTK